MAEQTKTRKTFKARITKAEVLPVVEPVKAPVVKKKITATGNASMLRLNAHTDEFVRDCMKEQSDEVVDLLNELLEFRRLANEKRLKQNESTQKSKLKKKNAGGEGDGEGGMEGKGVSKEQIIAKAVCDEIDARKRAERAKASDDEDEDDD